LVIHSSTITMMHGPINIIFFLVHLVSSYHSLLFKRMSQAKTLINAKKKIKTILFSAVGTVGHQCGSETRTLYGRCDSMLKNESVVPNLSVPD